MAKRITAQARSIAELLEAERRFLLPYFQRGYAWLDEHAERLFDDLLEVAEGRRLEEPDGTAPLVWYPLGSIIVSRAANSNDAWLADGHQRLITLTVLIAILRDLEDDAALKRRLDACIFLGDGDPAKPRLVTQADAQGFLAQYVQQPQATKQEFRGDHAECTDSERNIINNRNTLKNLIGNLSAVRRRTFARFVLDDCMIVENEVASEAIARLLFSTMHGTGLKPTWPDLFKADVLGAIEVEPREHAQSAWEGVEARLGRDALDVLLRQIAIIEKGRVPKGPVEDILKAAFKLDTHDGALAFVERRLDPLGEHLADMIDAAHGTGGLPPAVRRRAQYMDWVRGHDTWLAPALCWLEISGKDGDATVEFFRRLEALAWAEAITTQGPARRDEQYLRLISEIKSGRALGAGSSLDITVGRRKSMRDILAGSNFTRRRYKQLLLMRADAALQGDEALHVPARPTVEHIYPANPTSNSRWMKDFRGGGAATLRQRLGNLTLLTTAEQNEAANKDFDAKRKVYGRSVFALSRDLERHDTWVPKLIEDRTNELVDLLMRSWRLA